MASFRSCHRTLPEIVGFYSADHQKNYSEDLSELKYIRSVSNNEMPFELNGVVMRSSYYYDAVFINLLKYLKQNEGILVGELDNIPFVCNKMTLIKLCQTGSMLITACLHRNVIFLKARNVTEVYYSKQVNSKVPRNMTPVTPKDIPKNSRSFGRPQILSTVIADQKDTQELIVATPSPPVAAKLLAPIMTEPRQTSSGRKNSVPRASNYLPVYRSPPVEAKLMAPKMSLPPRTSSKREYRGLLEEAELMARTNLPEFKGPRMEAGPMAPLMALLPQTSSERDIRSPQVFSGLPEFGGYRAPFLEQRGIMMNKGPLLMHAHSQSIAVAEKEMRWRLKLKQFLQSDISLRRGDTTKPCFASQEFHCIYKYALKNHKIFYSGGIDGVIMNEKGPLIEMNLDKEEIVQQLNELDLVTLHVAPIGKEPTTKMRKHTSQTIWLNAHLNRAENIITGKVDYHGFLQSLINESNVDIAELGKGYWTPEGCLNQGDSLLTFIKDTINNSMNESHMNGYQMKKYFKQINDSCVEVSEENARDFPDIWFD